MIDTYAELTTRNIGFVTEAEQDKLWRATVFVPGCGGMGGACIMALARMGVGRLILADLDGFERSNMNRQLFAWDHTLDEHKAEATARLCAQINPEIRVDVHGADWMAAAEALIGQADMVVNGTDDLGASLLIYRTARALGRTVVDAYASPLPSVYVTRPQDTPHEERMGYPTRGTAIEDITDDQRATAFLSEAEWVVLNSSSRHYIDSSLIGEVIEGKRGRPSFAPMVISTGMLMAYEVSNGIMGQPHGADNRGWFFNPYKGRVERPRNPLLAAVLRPVVRRYLAGLMT